LKNFNLLRHLQHQAAWSEQTFGPGERSVGICDHIRKELNEIAEAHEDCDWIEVELEEWIDVVILAFDGAWRIGASPEQIIAALVAKQKKNEGRKWPDWRTVAHGVAIEHIKE
jgi:hypothetical protein